MSRLVLGLVLVLVTACTLLPRDAASRALAEADARAGQGEYPAAIAAYDAYLARYPEYGGVERARTARALLQQLIDARSEATTLQAQLLVAQTEAKTLRERLSAREAQLTSREAELSTREAEISRLRPDVAARDAEISRLRAELAQRQSEVAKLREDLEQLKRIDLEMERRRR